MYYHYTNIDSAFNIIDKSSVWFHSLAFMNDELEGYDFHRVLSEVEKSRNCGEIRKEILDAIKYFIHSNIRLQLSISATKLKDDITQWRAYTILGQGICIEFEDDFFKCSSTKVDCLYSLEDKKNSILQNELFSRKDSDLLAYLDTKKGLDEYTITVMDALIRFKHESFSPEQETRWVFQSTCIDDARFSLKFRPHRLGLTIYQDVNIDLNKLKSITLGPQVPDQNLNILEDFLYMKNCKAMVYKSDVTLR